PYQPRKPAADASREGIILQDCDRKRIGPKGLYQFFRATQRKAIDHISSIEECFRAARLESSSSDGLFPRADCPRGNSFPARGRCQRGGVLTNRVGERRIRGANQVNLHFPFCW